MANAINTLKAKFEEPSRFPNFGDAIVQVHIRGFRCHQNTVVDVRSPITAFCGLNGTGKSTVLQLVAASRRSSDANHRTYYIRDFFLVGNLDPQPYRNDASVTFKYWQEDRSTKQLTVSTSSRGRGWNGYKRRPFGHVFFAGIGLYLPKIEQRDLVARYYNKLTIAGSAVVAERIKSWTCRVLGHSYTGMENNTVRHNEKNAEIICVDRAGTHYSEIHMGFGEGRSQYLINARERMPDKSLILIEEPETSLHPSAQYMLGEYLVDVAIIKGHQIFLTTHSEFLLRALPDASRIFLHSWGDQIKTIEGLTSRQAESLMTGGQDKALCVLVEDECGRAVLREILRRVDPALLSSTHIAVGGDKDAVARTVRGLKDTGLKVAAVRDGDKEGSPAENIFKLPGTRPPEVEMFESEEVAKTVLSRYRVVLADFSVQLQGVDHHEWFARLAAVCAADEQAVLSEAARAYTASLPEPQVAALLGQLKEAAS